MRFALNSAAIHWCWVAAHLYEEQISIGVLAVTQACCQPVLQSSIEQLELTLPWTELQFTGAGSLDTCMKSKSS